MGKDLNVERKFWDVPDDGVLCSELANSSCVNEMHGMEGGVSPRTSVCD